jgi:hypothetical protein
MRALLSLVVLIGLVAAATPLLAADQILAAGLYEDESGPGTPTVHPRQVPLPPAPIESPVTPFVVGTLGLPGDDASPASAAWPPGPGRAPPAG